VPLSTIKSTVLNERKRVDNQSKARSGRPRQVTEVQRDHLYDLSQSSPYLKMQDLLTEVDGAVIKRALQYLLQELGLRKWR
jgi:transposase